MSPNVFNTEPIHEWYQFTREDKLNKFCDITEKLPIKQDARLLAGIFEEGFEFPLDNKRRYYLYVVTGESTINGIDMIEGDGLSFVDEDLITIVNPQIMIDNIAPLHQIKIISFKEKHEWDLVTKYNIGKKPDSLY